MPQNPFAGIGDFVAAITGGPQVRETAYRDELGGMASLDKKLAEARMATDQARAQAALDPTSTGRLLQIEDPALQGDWSNILRAGGGNAAVLSQALLRANELGARQNATALAMEPDSGYSPVNAQLAGLASGPQQTSAITGNNLILDRFSDAPAVIPTEIGQAMIAANQALMGQRNAAAAASSAQADLRRRTDPNRPRGKSADTARSTDVGEQRKVIRGKAYVKRNGQWFEE